MRISDESRTSTAVVDPTATSYTEINEWGPHVEAEELEMLLEKLRYLTTGAETVVFAGSLPRGVEDGFYAETIRDLNRRGVKTVLDSEGEPLRLGTGAEPFLVSPNQREAESLVGQEFHEDQDFIVALDSIAELGARNVLITQESGCFALFREDREVKRFRAVAPRVEPVSTVGSGDALLAAFLAARHAASRSRRRCARPSGPARRRRSRSAPAASTRARRAASGGVEVASSSRLRPDGVRPG